MNNKQLSSQVIYKGIGGHLFAIAAQKSYEYGFDGFLTGFAANEKLMFHYCKEFGAEAIQILHPYQIGISPEESKKLMDVYTYEWTDEKL